MVFTEFGRRVKENFSRGTDHGTATPMYVLGKKVKGGFYNRFPSLTDLDANGHLKMTTDFRQVYATLIQEWMGGATQKNVAARGCTTGIGAILGKNVTDFTVFPEPTVRGTPLPLCSGHRICTELSCAQLGA